MNDEAAKKLDEIFSLIKKIENRVSKLEAFGKPSSDEDASANKKLSLKEFIIDRAPSNAVQTTLTIAYYLEKFEGASPFNGSDLDRAFRMAREPVPKNINDKANMCVKNGFFMEDKSKKDNLKAWLVTRTGEDIVRGGFGKSRG